MFNFSHSSSTVVHFGEGMIKEIKNEIPNDSKVLLLYDRGFIKDNGIYDEITTILKGYEWSEFDCIESSPQYDTLMKAVKLVRSDNYTYLLAVGGGSVIDGAKFISVATNHQRDDIWESLIEGDEIHSALPIGCVLTSPSRGSVNSNNSVISRGKDKLSFSNHFVLPKFAVLDPTIVNTLSEKQIINGVIDVFARTMEQYLTHPISAKIQDRFAEDILLTLIEDGIKILKVPEDLDIRSNIMYAATQALNGLINTGNPCSWLTYALGHEVMVNYSVDHARTLSILLPAIMKKFSENKQDKIIRYAEYVWQITEGSNEEIIEQAIDATVNFFHVLNVPTSFSEAGIVPNINELINCLEKHRSLESPAERENDVTIDEAKEIYELAM